MRAFRSLRGLWQFQTDPQGTLQVETIHPDREIPVPLPWQAAFPELEHYSGYAWYRTQVDLDETWLTGELLLVFGAVDYWCQVFVNKQLVCEHEGGYTPFSVTITGSVHAGENEIAVRVYDPVQKNITIRRWPDGVEDRETPPFDARNIPHGKQEWYINAGGLWQDVTLVSTAKTYIDHVKVTPDIHTGRVDVVVQLAGDLGTVSGHQITLHVEGTQVAVRKPLTPGHTMVHISLQVDQPHLWTVDDPYLYALTAQLESGDAYDSLQTRLGFREIRTQNGQLLLNGEPLFLLAALDQDLYPNTIYSVPSEAFLRDEFQKAKALGLNCLRCHIKPPDPLYLDLADEMGLLIWEEIPSWRTFYQKTTIHPQDLYLQESIKNRCRKTLEEMIRRDGNHPSVIIWTIVNEDWGTALPLSEADRTWIAEMYDLCKRLDPTRLVVDNSPCPAAWGPSIHVKSDLDDFHVYANIPDQAENFVKLIDQFSLRPLWTYSSYSDSVRTGEEPLILSEFGNWGLPTLNLLKTPSGSEPSWFKTGPWWASWEGEPGWPCDAEKRFKELGLDRIWPDYDSMAAATQWHQFQAMKFEIEAMRRRPGIAGYVITELSDIYWESNGLLDFERNPKVYFSEFAAINAADVIVPQLKSYAYWDDDTVPVILYASHYSPAEWSNARLHWRLGEITGQADLPDLPRGAVRQVLSQYWKLPPVLESSLLTVDFSVQDQRGNVLASNGVTLLVLPASARIAAYTDEVAVVMNTDAELVPETVFSAEGGETAGASSSSGSNSDGTLSISTDRPPALPTSFAATLGGLGYRVSRELTETTQLVVTDYPDADLLEWVRNGGDMLFLSSGPGPFFWRQGRTGTYGGGWISSFTWVRPGVHRRLTISNPLTLPFMHIMPTGTILGLPVQDASVQRDFLAGQVSGWLHHPAVDTVQFRYGKGRVIMTTFSIYQALQKNATDPAAIAMLHDLIDYFASPDCQPRLTANY